LGARQRAEIENHAAQRRFFIFSNDEFGEFPDKGFPDSSYCQTSYGNGSEQKGISNIVLASVKLQRLKL